MLESEGYNNGIETYILRNYGYCPAKVFEANASNVDAAM